MLYDKHALSFSQQLDLLKERGLGIADDQAALNTLRNVSYYRLSAYFKPFIQPRSESFTPGTDLEAILDLYAFDRDLRALFGESLECIEVHFRTRITYELAMRGGPFAHTRPELFLEHFDHADFMAKQAAKERRDTAQFVRHFKDKYENPQLPIWMATELMSFGTLSWLFSYLRTDIQQAISSTFDVDKVVVANWIECTSYIRNICAHHGRLWNRELAKRPIIPRDRERWTYTSRDNKRCYVIFLLLQDMIAHIDPAHPSRAKAAAFLAKQSDMKLAGMQVPRNWRALPPWQGISPE